MLMVTFVSDAPLFESAGIRMHRGVGQSPEISGKRMPSMHIPAACQRRLEIWHPPSEVVKGCCTMLYQVLSTAFSLERSSGLHLPE